MSTEMSSCYCCRTTFPTASVKSWVEGGGGPNICPNCGLDFVLMGRALSPEELETEHLAGFGVKQIVVDGLLEREVEIHGVFSRNHLMAGTYAVVVGPGLIEVEVSTPSEDGAWKALVVAKDGEPVPPDTAVRGTSSSDLLDRIAELARGAAGPPSTVGRRT